MSREKTRLFCPSTSDLNGTGKGLKYLQLWNLKHHQCAHKSFTMQPILRQAKPFYIFSIHILKTQFRNRKQHWQGGIALPWELIYQTRQLHFMKPLPLLKFAGEACTRKDYDVCCYTGIRLEELQHQMEEIYLKTRCPDVTVIHAGTNMLDMECQLLKLWEIPWTQLTV